MGESLAKGLPRVILICLLAVNIFFAGFTTACLLLMH